VSFLSGEKVLFISVVIAGYIFSLIDSLFFGYYLWLYFGPQFFLLYFFCSVPFVFINCVNNYAQIYSKIKEIKLTDIINKIQDSPWLTIAQIVFLIILGYFTYSLYIIYYGSWVIQILKILRNKMGFSGMEWIHILVFLSLIPESLSFCVSLFNNIKQLCCTIYAHANPESISLKLIVKNLPYIILAAIAVAGAIVSAQISASYMLFTYQHYLMEFYQVSVPTIKNKTIILVMMFADIFFTIKQFFESLYKTYEEKDFMNLKDNYYSYIILCFTIFMRAISKIVLAVGIATSPWNINIKASTFLQSMFDDFSSINNANNSYSKAIMRFAILFSLFNVVFYMALIYSGHIQISLGYALISVSIALLLSFVTPIAIYNTSNSSIAIDNEGYTSSSSFANIDVGIFSGISSRARMAKEMCSSYMRCL
jgi:hypothetical protein